MMAEQLITFSKIMKRPISIYFVATWCFLGLVMKARPLSRWLAANFSDGSSSVETGEMIGGIVFILIIWHVVCLIQLKSFNRWFSIVVFGWWMLFCSSRAYVCYHIAENPLRP